jgi:hypothetical protein
MARGEHVSITGPLFDGRARSAIRDLQADLTWAVAAEAEAEVGQLLDASIVNPTPYYETQITRQRVSDEQATVHDRGIVYGPWLEGTGSRNQTTRFKGYASFRRATQAVQNRVDQVVRPAVQAFLRRMN